MNPTIAAALQATTKGGARIPGRSPGLAPKVHAGPIHSPVAGRTDHLPMHVASGSYVLPADIVSSMGEGNSMAGFRVAKSLFTAPNRTKGLPYGAAMPRADGGAVDTVPIVAAGGEYVIAPQDVVYVGDGSLGDGHRALDEFVRQMRAKTIKTLKALPGPRKD